MLSTAPERDPRNEIAGDAVRHGLVHETLARSLFERTIKRYSVSIALAIGIRWMSLVPS